MPPDSTEDQDQLTSFKMFFPIVVAIPVTSELASMV